MPRTTTNARREAALAWLLGRINYEATAAIPYDERGMKLDRMRELCRRLGDPQDRLRCVHVAGTKGKGSTAAMIAGALGTVENGAGRTVGVYSSPHFDHLEERFAVAGKPCSAEELIALVDRVRVVAEAMDERGAGPTYFDLTTAMAFVHFAERAVDAAIIEVGLGGRLDSTNVLRPVVSVLTSISLDHQRQLGDTPELIAAEKAGIIKRGVPVVSGVTAAGPAGVIERIAREHDAPLTSLGRDFAIEPSADGWTFTMSDTDGPPDSARDGWLEGALDGVRPAAPGRAHAENAAVALATLAVLHEAEPPLATSADDRRRGIAHARLPGRMERFPGAPLVVIDGAHNDASAVALAEALAALCAPAERRVLLVAIAADKDAAAVLRPLVGRFDHVVTTRFVENPRAAAPETLAAIVGELGGSAAPCSAMADPAAAYAEAVRLAGRDGAVVVAGSLLFAAETRRRVVAERGGG